jgi:hypothetical protein
MAPWPIPDEVVSVLASLTTKTEARIIVLAGCRATSSTTQLDNSSAAMIAPIDCQMAARHGPDLPRDLMVGFERYALHGPVGDEAAAPDRLGPEAAWKIAIERAEEERAQAAQFDAVRSGLARNDEEQLAVDSTEREDWRRGRLRDAIAVRERTKCIWDLFRDVLS